MNAEFNSFFAGAKALYEANLKKVGPSLYEMYLDPNIETYSFNFKNGRKYIKIIAGGCAWGFVNKENGDVLKAASWNAPATHARGNIYDESNGLSRITAYGPMYLS